VLSVGCVIYTLHSLVLYFWVHNESMKMCMYVVCVCYRHNAKLFLVHFFMSLGNKLSYMYWDEKICYRGFMHSI